MRTDELDYHLPPELIATTPSEPRDSARLLVLSRSEPDRLEHRTVRDLPELLRAGDVLVRNTSRVLPARFRGVRADSGGKVEGLYLHDGSEPGEWVAMVRARRFRPGAPVRLLDPRGEDSGVVLTLIERAGDGGAWRCRVEPSQGVLDRVGLTPLPPYIVSARAQAGLVVDESRDRERYQTVYADRPGSVAAPTAGLHFTPELWSGLDARGVGHADVVLHVGAGTFKPIETERVEDHPMHEEWCSIAPAAAAELRAAARRICVGTTACRTLESYAPSLLAGECPEQLITRLLIAPGYAWKMTDGLLTNFHLPRSTLLAMVSALLPGGLDRLLEVYRVAIEHDYRFYSYGDAMLILP